MSAKVEAAIRAREQAKKVPPKGKKAKKVEPVVETVVEPEKTLEE